ncbi:MAG TPA: protein-glutamate O-methyltransferase CheR [Polyangiales bacterium]|nr:protein-glutamate O-methyltransferase CheR [Polyangiales bacterium]
MPDLTTTPQVFAILSGLIEEKLGLSYTLADKSLLESKVSVRALELGFESVLEYYYYLRYDDPDQVELDLLTEALVVNETFFYREYDQLHAMLSTFVAPMIAAGRRPRIWSAACSTGEEPATIAMWLAERGLLDSVELFASDISHNALKIARAGRYRSRSLRQVPNGVDPERFIKREDQTFVLASEIRDAINFRRLNLLSESDVAAMGMMDIVLCRNLLIYFRDDVVRRVVDRLVARLHPGGVLLVGVSESLMRFGTSVVCEEHAGAFVYRKRAAP